MVIMVLCYFDFCLRGMGFGKYMNNVFLIFFYILLLCWDGNINVEYVVLILMILIWYGFVYFF